MKLLYLTTTIVVLLIGCTAIKEGYHNFKDCVVDRDCRQQSVEQGKNYQSYGTAIGGIVPFPLSASIVGAALFGIGFTLNAIKGRKK